MAKADRPSAPTLDPETLSRLAGGLVHELKNPLSTIGLHLALLEETWRTEDAAKARRSLQALGRVKAEVARLNDILEDFLRFARTDVLELAAADLNALVEQIARFVQPEMEAQKVTLRTHFDLDLPPVQVDAARLGQALLNLLINARQALEGRGGQITLITRREPGWVLVEVLDDGPGMSAEVLARCFEIWFSTKKGGTGLGLPTVRRLLDAHGGTLALESAPGRGTRAVMRLPVAEEPTRA
jgi:signal transduction histidine kinase